MTVRMMLVMTLLCLSVIMLIPTLAEQGMNGPPERPKVFRNPEELKKYLKALNEYFAIVGRPRYVTIYIGWLIEWLVCLLAGWLAG